jgi:drug/metabolite transporter (DMT)-like permease
VRTVAVLIGLAAFAGLVVMAVAGVTAATAVLVTGAAVVGMIALGSLLGARRTPEVSPDREDRNRTREG